MPAADPERSSWVVVVPVKDLAVAKSRLVGIAPADRADLALAMACDVVAAARSCDVVTAVVVITNDLRAAEATGAVATHVVADADDAGLNPALVGAARVAGTWYPRAGVAALAADLPALRQAELGTALAAAWLHPRAFVPDWRRVGTTLLTARAGVPLDPAFGRASGEQHRRGGAAELSTAEWRGLRQDVDTQPDLQKAVELGVGAHTAAVLARLGIARPEPR